MVPVTYSQIRTWHFTETLAGWLKGLPTNEVDASSIKVFLKYLASLGTERTVLVTTHQLDIFMPLNPTVLHLGSTQEGGAAVA